MKACTTLPWSCAKAGQWRCCQPHWKQISGYASSTVPRNPASPMIPQSDASREHPSFHVDKENKTVATAVGDLPLSPIMDPDYWDATMGLRAPKPKESKAQNSLERQFRKSPFANALGTPIRQCTATKIRLPSFFLQDFNLIAHPTTNRPWWVPRSFAREQPAEIKQVDPPPPNTEIFTDEESHAEQASPDADREEPDTPGSILEADHEKSGIQVSAHEADREKLDTQGPPPEAGREEPGTQGSPPEAETSTTVQTEHQSPYGPSAYVFARQELIASFTKPGSSFLRHNQNLFGGSSSRFVSLGRNAIWRQDMGPFILDLMQKEIIDEILYLSKLCIGDSRKYIVKCHDWNDIKDMRDGAVLWFEADTAEPEAFSDPESEPGLFAVYDTGNDGKSTSVAVHNMALLLGAETAAKLKREAEVLAGGSLFYLSGRRTVDLRLKLWRLAGYIADFRELP